MLFFLIDERKTEAYSNGWKKAKSEGKDKDSWTEAGRSEREKCLAQLQKAGILVAQQYTLP